VKTNLSKHSKHSKPMKNDRTKQFQSIHCRISRLNLPISSPPFRGCNSSLVKCFDRNWVTDKWPRHTHHNCTFSYIFTWSFMVNSSQALIDYRRILTNDFGVPSSFEFLLRRWTIDNDLWQHKRKAYSRKIVVLIEDCWWYALIHDCRHLLCLGSKKISTHHKIRENFHHFSDKRLLLNRLKQSSTIVEVGSPDSPGELTNSFLRFKIEKIAVTKFTFVRMSIGDVISGLWQNLSGFSLPLLFLHI
jgi:hypothetical protein